MNLIVQNNYIKYYYKPSLKCSCGCGTSSGRSDCGNRCKSGQDHCEGAQENASLIVGLLAGREIGTVDDGSTGQEKNAEDNFYGHFLDK
jgi:hypothetical protein